MNEVKKVTMTIDKSFTAKGNVKKLREDAREFAKSVTPQDLYQWYRQQTNTISFGIVIIASAEAFSDDLGNTRFMVELLVNEYTEMTYIRYFTDALGNINTWSNLVTVQRFVEKK